MLVAAGSARLRSRDDRIAGPAALSAASESLDALTWRAAMAVATDPEQIAARSLHAFAAAEREQPPLRRCPPNLRILRAIHAAAQAPGGVATERAAACERAAYALDDWHAPLTSSPTSRPA